MSNTTKYPPGTIKVATVHADEIHEGAVIHHSWQKTIKPLNPLTFIERNSDLITLYATVFIDTDTEIKHFDIFANQNIEVPEVYIAYDAKDEIPKSLSPYTFRVNYKCPGANPVWPTKINVHLWDEDPTGSRGTETTVENGLQ